MVLEQDIETAEFRIHDDNRDRDTFFTQFGSLVGYRHGQIVATMFLKGLRQLVRAGSITESFYHTNHLSLRL